MSVKTIIIENKEEIETLLRKHRFVGTNFRVNVASNDETTETPGGIKILKNRINLTSKKRGRCLTPWSNTIRGLNN